MWQEEGQQGVGTGRGGVCQEGPKLLPTLMQCPFHNTHHLIHLANAIGPCQALQQLDRPHLMVDHDLVPTVELTHRPLNTYASWITSRPSDWSLSSCYWPCCRSYSWCQRWSDAVGVGGEGETEMDGFPGATTKRAQLCEECPTSPPVPNETLTA